MACWARSLGGDGYWASLGTIKATGFVLEPGSPDNPVLQASSPHGVPGSLVLSVAGGLTGREVVSGLGSRFQTYQR